MPREVRSSHPRNGAAWIPESASYHQVITEVTMDAGALLPVVARKWAAGTGHELDEEAVLAGDPVALGHQGKPGRASAGFRQIP